ncbi:MAG: hypothetical protein H7Z37_15410 [Pyrinomonadaceae bacterium]|nr:hypothetical protein [Pyrinomonadaceae bacterium]
MSKILLMAGKWGGLLTIIALIITLLRSVIELVGFLMAAFKIGLVVAFISLIAIIALLAIRTFQNRRRERQDI